MNARRFATMTGSLLARKGEASPTIVPEDPNAPVTWTTDPLVKQTELRVMAFPKREREVEPATMHFDWPDEPNEAQPAHDLREYVPPPQPKPEPRLVAEPEPARVVHDLRAPSEPEPVRHLNELRTRIEQEIRPVQEVRPVTDLRPRSEQPPRPVNDLRANGEQEPVRPAEAVSERRSFFSESGGEKRHRMSLGLTQEEHERLGIVAVKKGLTRHQLMRDALDHYFDKLANDYKSECACISVGGCKNGCDDESA